VPRIAAIDPDSTDSPELNELFSTVLEAFGGQVPNLMRTFANNPAVLRAWLHLAQTLSTTFTPQLQQQIAVAVAQANACPYCLAANVAFGQAVGVSDADLDAARYGTAADPHAAALVGFAASVVVHRGHLTDTHLASARAAGATDSDLVAVIGLIAMNTMMNYTNNVAETEIDWPDVKLDLPRHVA
jgi:AhpD family alkylhydroperoxidase